MSVQLFTGKDEVKHICVETVGTMPAMYVSGVRIQEGSDWPALT
jgi:hypothetical protein